MKINNQKKILLVEDEILIALYEQKELENYGYKVITANSGKKAVESADSIPDIDIILMDINLGPGIDGTQAAQEILKKKDIPIVFLSSHTEPEIVEKTEKITSYGYVVKNSGIVVLDTSIKMAFKLFESRMHEKEKEMALKESEELYQALFEQAGDGNFLLGLDGKILSVNESFCKMHGYTIDEMINIGLEGIDVKEATSLLQERINKIKSGETLYIEVEHYHKDGHLFPLAVTAKLVTLGKKQFILASHRDLTERKNVENQIKVQQQRTTSILSGIADTFYSLDTDWRFTVVNPAAEKAPFGRPASELLGKIIWELYPQLIGTRIHQHYLDAAANHTLEHYEALSPLNKKWYEVFLQGWTNGVDVYMRDITGRKLMEKALRESEEKYRLLHESAGIGISYYNLDGTVISYNRLAAENMGGVPEDFNGKSIYDIFTKEEALFYHERIKKAAESNGNMVYEDLIHLPSGDKYFISTFTRITGSNNDLLGIQIISQDITERRKIEEALRESKKSLEQAQHLSKTGSWKWDVVTGEVFWSKELRLIIGYDPDQPAPLFEKMLSFYTPESWTILTKSVNNALTTGESYQLELDLIRTDGIKIQTLAFGEADYDKNGKVTGLHGTVQDITEQKLLENALQESESHFNSILDNTNVGYFYIDSLGIIRDVNDAWVRLYKYESKEEIIGRHFTEVQKISDVEKAKEFVDGIMRGESKYMEGEFSRKCKDNSTGYHSFSARPAVRSGKIDGIEGIIIDITKLKNAEEAISKEKTFVYKIMETSPIGIVLLDSSGVITYANARAEDILGLSKNEITQKYFNEPSWRITDFEGNPFPEENLPFSIVIKTGRSVFGVQHAIEWPNGRKIYLSINASPIMDDNGKVTGMISAIEDISERKLLEESKNKSETLFKSLFESMIEGVALHEIIYDNKNAVDYIIININKSFEIHTGIQRKDIMGKKASHVYGTGTAPYLDIYSRVVQSGNPEIFNTYFPPMKKHFVISVFKISENQFATVFEDITEQKINEEKIKKQLNEKEILLKEVHHRIKNNINSIESILKLQEKTVKNIEAQSILQDTISRIENMRIIYDKLLISDDYRVLSVKNYLEDLIHAIISIFPENKKIKIINKIDDFQMNIKTLFSLGSIINELVTNSMKYAFTDKESGKIELILTKNDKNVSLTVCDNGIGLPADFNIEKSKGFGLMVIKMLVEQLSGSIVINSKKGMKCVVEFKI